MSGATPENRTNPLEPFEQREPCWCESGHEHGSCHGSGPRSLPGAALPPDDETGFWIAPNTKVRYGAFSDAIPEEGIPIAQQSKTLEQRPITVNTDARRRSSAVAGSQNAPRSLAQLGALRIELYDDYGLDSERTIAPQLQALQGRHLEEIATEVLALSEETAAAVLNRPSGPSIWCDGHKLTRLVGQTMFWANHYFVPDPLGARLLDGRLDPDGLAPAIRAQVSQRHLIERGLVVPFSTDLALPWISGRVMEATAENLTDDVIVNWVDTQLRLEGPTEREALLVRALDDHRALRPFFFGQADSDTPRIGISQLLGSYDHEYDYQPWIKEVRERYIADIVQETNISVGMAELFQGRWLAPSPFRARLMRMMGVPRLGPDFFAEITVPWLPGIDQKTLTSFAQNDQAVNDLRQSVARCIDAIDAGESGVRDLQEFVNDQSETAVNALHHNLQTDKLLKRLVPGAAIAGSLVLSATLGPVGLATGALSAIAAGAPLAADHLPERRAAPFLFWTARKREADASPRAN